MAWRSTIAALILAGAAFPASAQAPVCDPPPGLSPQQWYNVCGGALQQAFSMGLSQGMPWNDFAAYMYQAYVQGPAVAPSPMQGGGSGGPMMCQLGQSQCFSGYVRTCQQMATGGTWWVTSAQQCR